MNSRSSILSVALSLGIALLCATSISAGTGVSPTAGPFVPSHPANGTAKITGMDSDRVTIIQSGDRLLMDWSGFNIPVNGMVKFVQPDSDSIAIVRVTGAQASDIEGRLEANGAVWLVNPNGAVIGGGGTVDVNDLWITAAGLPDAARLLSITVGQDSIAHPANPDAATQVLNEGAIAVRDTLRIDAREIVHSGVISAHRGEVVLSAGEKGTLTASGVIDVSSRKSGQTGGTVHLLGGRVIVDAAARIDASGPAGGGTVLVGGDLRGQGGVKTATRTVVGKGARIDAGAGRNGKGGKVILWAEETSVFGGEIQARGGPAGGDGGFVEVSGKHLAFRGRVDTFAPQGLPGTLLLDPANITISNGSGDGEVDGTTTFSGTPSGTVGTVLQGDTGPSIIFESELEGLSATTNIVIEATNNITVNNLADNVLAFQATTGSVTFTADADSNGTGAFTMTAGDTITTAGGSVTISGATVALSGAVTTGGGALSVTATANGLTIATTLSTGGGALTISAGGGPLNVFVPLNNIGGSTTLSGIGVDFAATGDVDVGSGTLSVNAGAGSISTALGTELLGTGAMELRAANLALVAGSQIGGSSPGTGQAASVLLAAGGAGNPTVGVAGGFGAVQLPAASLSVIRATSLSIGSATAGNIDFGAWTPNAILTGTLTLISGAGITQNGALDLSSLVGGLVVDAAGNVDLGNADNNFDAVNVLQSGSLTLVNSDALTVLGVASSGNAVLDASNVVVAPSAEVNTGTGSLTLNVGTLTMDAGSALLSTGSIELNVTTYALAATAQIGGSALGARQAARVTLHGGAGATIGVAGAAGTVQLTAATLARVRAIDVVIGDAASGAITLSNLEPSAVFATGTLELRSNSSISQSGTLNLFVSGGSLLVDTVGAVSMSGFVVGSVQILSAGNVFTDVVVAGSVEILSATFVDLRGLITGDLTVHDTTGLATTRLQTLSINGDVSITLNSLGAALLFLSVAVEGDLSATVDGTITIAFDLTVGGALNLASTSGTNLTFQASVVAGTCSFSPPLDADSELDPNVDSFIGCDPPAVDPPPSEEPASAAAVDSGGCLITHLTRDYLADDALNPLREVREWLWQSGDWGRFLVRAYYRASVAIIGSRVK